MASTSSIKASIKAVVNRYSPADYSLWTIGITSDLEGRKKAHGDPKDWHHWEADSLEVAREVETYFLNDFPEKEEDRMNGGTGGDIDNNKTVYVYIY